LAAFFWQNDVCVLNFDSLLRGCGVVGKKVFSANLIADEFCRSESAFNYDSFLKSTKNIWVFVDETRKMLLVKKYFFLSIFIFSQKLSRTSN
jgi:hypothetical protein